MNINQKPAEVVYIRKDQLSKARVSPYLCEVGPQDRDDKEPIYTAEQVRQAQREAVAAAVPEPLTDTEIWSMARKMAYLFDYPWGSMPIEGRRRMFMNVKAMIAAAKEPS